MAIRTEPPTLSVVIPTLNEAAAIVATLSSFQALRHTGTVEVILVDGGSKDETTSVGGPLVDQLLTAQRGRAAQMNKGVAHAEGDYVLFLHADTNMSERQLRALITRLAPGCIVWGRFDVRIDAPHVLLRVVEWLVNWRSRLTGIATGDQAIFIRRSTLVDLGGFADLPIMEDIELTSRLRRIARPTCLHERVQTSARRWLQHGIVRTIVLMWLMRAAYACGVSPQRLKRWYADHQSPRFITKT